MQTKKYSLASTTWDENEYKAMQNVIDSKIFTMGKKVIEFEEKFSKRFDSKYSVMVNSGSSANLLMIAALFYTKNQKLKLNKGDEVIVPSVSWSTTYYPLLQYGLKLKFVDVDLDTLNFDIESLKTAVSEKTRVIFMVNLLGNSNEMTEINNIISDKNIVKLLDNCESLGSKYQHKESSSNALMSSFSTFFSHHISTMEGGVITTNNLELYHILLSLRAHGWTRNLPNENEVTGTKNPDPFIESFNFVLPGFNVRPMELSGAIGIEQLKKFDDLLLMRRKNAELFVEMFKDIKGIKIQREIGESSWFGFSIILTSEFKKTRTEALKELALAGVDTRPIVAGNFVRNPVIKYFDYKVHGKLTNSDILHKNGFFVGNHHYDLKNEFNLLKNTLLN
ncbi:DegT/DnrJ/EryC1/StrS family aminotransferase [Flavobacteriaceae bacterium]|nr:DegT/DnrJ/EryC1/StrS family aminotransferase [Flavobacteriaceae bacterium]MDB9901543.1 DegT/DnrJ/EryC1/StrS family aminotransferase [Flavobacteriaceae bacterium]MDC0958380.1 DegT/DnrJ/EryC1/StrS family aminotransferase [Flavobacteriaceae bacterium]